MVEAKAENHEPNDHSINVQGISKFFGSLVAVNKLSFTVRKGEIVGFLGPNGSGKTTTMRMLTSFYSPDIGHIEIDGIDTSEQDMETRYRIGYLPENNPFYADLQVKEYLDFVSDLRGLSKEDRRNNLPSTVDETGLKDVYYRPIGQLSKGYKQRVGLAQAILHRPSILILDEPTEGLDPNQRLTIRELIKSLGKERTVLISTHIMQEVENTCERVLVINRGRLLTDSPVNELLLRAEGIRTVHIEIEGRDVERHLNNLPNLESMERHDATDGRKKYTLSTSADDDLRPKVFNLAKQNDWILYELREERARMEDIFYDLTSQEQNQDQVEKN